MKYTTYLFDFDYTLADSSRGIVICFRNVLERHEHTGITDEAIKRTIGKTLEDSFSILTGINDPEILAGYKKEYVKEADTHMTANTVFFPETVAVLNELKSQGAKIGIISTKFRYRIREMLDQHFPKDFFDVIIGGEDVKKPKPHPQGIRKALRKLHRRKGETLYIGDSTVDAQTAQLAKVDFVGVLNGITTREELAIYPHRQILDNLSLLPLVNKPNPYKPCKYCPDKAIAWYRLIHQKQIRGKQERKDSTMDCTCKNCGKEFQGNHCPHCGQSRHTPRFTLRNACQNILSGFFNIDNGFSRNLLELLYRPGYMIRDYLKGKRVHYFKPFQTLFVLAALYIMAVQLIDPKAIKEGEETGEQTLSGLIDNIKFQKNETTDDTIKFYLGQSLLYADSAKWAEDNATEKILQTQPEEELSIEAREELTRKIRKEIKNGIKKQVRANDGDIDDWEEAIQDIDSSMAHQDSVRIANLGREANKYDSIRTEIRKEILADLSDKENPYESSGFWEGVAEVARNLGSALDEVTNHYFSENSFFSAVTNLMKGWVHGNKAFSILALLPLVTLGTRWAFRRTPVGRQLNLTENFFAQVFIACQILWISLLILPFTGKAHMNEIFDLSYQAIFVLFVWNNRQLFGLSWWKSFWRTILMFWYCLLGLTLICVIIISFIVLIACLVQLTR